MPIAHLIKRGVVTCLAASLAVVGSAANADTGRFHPAAQPGTEYHDWFQAAVRGMQADEFSDSRWLFPDKIWASEYLVDDSNVYSGLKPALFDGPRNFKGLPTELSLTRAIAWDLGLDKALPGFQAPVDHVTEQALLDASTGVRSNLIKAGVSMKYFDQAFLLGRYRALSTLVAELAVSLQVLDEWVRTSSSEERELLGIREDVLRRAEVAKSLDALSEEDVAYLADILRSELSQFRAGGANIHGIRSLSTPLRIARVAAAYRDGARYPEGRPCFDDGTVNHQYAGRDPTSETRPICTMEATDRVVYERYLAERKRQLSSIEPRNPSQQRLAKFFETIRPAWAGAYPDEALRKANNVEVVESQLALLNGSWQQDEVRFMQLVERANLVVYPGVYP